MKLVTRIPTATGKIIPFIFSFNSSVLLTAKEMAELYPFAISLK